jgi:SAM-dependent methyltransferase
MSNAPWHEDERFWELSAPLMFSQPRLEVAREECDHLLALVSLQPGARILDLGCGVGRHSVELAGQGFVVTGVDRVPAFLERGKELAREAGVNVEFIQADMREFTRPGAFELALSLSNSFGQFRDPKEEKRTLENIFLSLARGGSLVLEITGKEVMKCLFRPEDSYGDANTRCLEERRVLGDWEFVETRLEITRGSETAGFVYSYRLYSAREISALLESVGFSEVKVFGSLEGSLYDKDASRLVLVAKK